MAFFNCFMNGSGIENGESLFEMLDGGHVGLCLATSFGQMQLGNIEQYFDWSPNVHDAHLAPENDALTDMLYCHETMQADDLHLSLGPAHGTLVLPARLREQAGTLTDADWARLCEVGVAAAVQHGGWERECAMEEFGMPVLELSAPHDAPAPDGAAPDGAAPDGAAPDGFLW